MMVGDGTTVRYWLCVLEEIDVTIKMKLLIGCQQQPSAALMMMNDVANCTV